MPAKCLCSDSDCACIESRQRGPCGTYSPSCGLAEMQHGHQQQPLCGNKRNSAGLSLRSQGLNACLPLEQRDCWMFGCHTRIIRIPGGPRGVPGGPGTPVGPPCDPPWGPPGTSSSSSSNSSRGGGSSTSTATAAAAAAADNKSSCSLSSSGAARTASVAASVVVVN